MAISKVPSSGITADFDNTLTSADLAPNSVDSSELVDGSIDTSHLSNNIAINTSGAITTTGAFTSKGIDDNADATAMTIDSNENIGVGCTPDAWEASMTAIDIGQQGGIAGATSGDMVALTQNAYTDGTWKHKNTDESAMIEINDGAYTFKVASSGTADNAISWTNAMFIKNNAYVGIGTTSPSRSLHINGTTMGPVMEGEMIWSKDFTWASNSSPSNTATGLTYGMLGSSGAIYMFHFYWANSNLTDSYGYKREMLLYRNDYQGLWSASLENSYGHRSGTAGFSGYPYLNNPGTSQSGTTVTIPFQRTAGGNASYNAIMYVSVHKIHCDTLFETN